jgi:O-antigen/teichoic acid export membrane protein
MFGLGNLLVPLVARVKASEGAAAAWRAALRQGAQFGTVLAAYFAAVAVWPGAVLRLLYGAGSPYAGLTGPLRWMVAAYAFTFAAQVMGQYLAGVGNSRETFLAQGAAALASMAVGLPLAAKSGLMGAAAGVAAVNVARATASCRFTQRELRVDRPLRRRAKAAAA